MIWKSLYISCFAINTYISLLLEFYVLCALFKSYLINFCLENFNTYVEIRRFCLWTVRRQCCAFYCLRSDEWQNIYKDSCSFFIFVSVHHKSIIYNKPTRCNSGSLVFINNYKYSLHVSDAHCVHHQEHYKL